MSKQKLGWWDEWRGSYDGRPSMMIKRLFSWRGYRIDLHKFVRADDPKCFHTHPSNAWRVCLWGGYVEEIMLGGRYEHRTIFPGFIGLVRPELCHRIHALRNGRSSYSLWFRGPKIAEIQIIGEC